MNTSARELPATSVDLNDTPIVTIDMDIVEHNIRSWQKVCDDLGISFRPHIKTHKSPDLAHMQLAAGAQGITCQTLGEVEVMLDAGIEDIFLSYNIIGDAKLRRLRELTARATISTVCDNEVVARALSQTMRETERILPVLVECDTGTGRTGVQTPQEAVELARLISGLPGLRFAGLMTYPITPDTGRFLQVTLQELADQGLECETVSTGGTPALSLLAEVPAVTEHRAGAYIYHDRNCVDKGVATWETCAMRVRATVVSRPTPRRAIIDAGSKSLSSDVSRRPGYGHIVEYPNAVIYKLNEEHGYVELVGEGKSPEVGEVITIIPNHACVVTNLHDTLVGVRDGRFECLIHVAARGLVR